MTLQKLKDEAKKELDEICFYSEELSIFETPDYNPKKPVYRKTIKAEHLGDVECKILPNVKKLIDSLIDKVYEEGRKSIVNKEIKKTAEVTNNIFDCPACSTYDFPIEKNGDYFCKGCGASVEWVGWEFIDGQEN